MKQNPEKVLLKHRNNTVQAYGCLEIPNKGDSPEGTLCEKSNTRKNRNVTVSVALCTYNGEKYIRNQLDSIIKQTRPVEEIIVCDDCSSDRTVQIVYDILKEFKGSYKVIEKQENKGVVDSFTQAYDLCIGDIIFSCDQDDVWENNKVQRILNSIDDNTVLVFSDGVLVDKDLIPLDISIWQSIGLKYTEVDTTNKFSARVLKSFCVVGAAMAFRKSLWNSVKPILSPCLHDLYLSLLAPFFGKVIAIPEQLVLYRRHGENYTAVGNNNTGVNQSKYASRFYTEYKELRAVSAFLNQSISNMNYNYSHSILEAIKYHKVSQYLVEDNPRFLKILKLTKEFVLGRYRKYRGVWKLFILDLHFIITTKNDPLSKK